MSYKLPELPYEYSALEPFVDKQIMIIHHTKHHQKYVNSLNTALKETQYPETNIGNLIHLIKTDDTLPVEQRDLLNFNAGGHYNHCLYWHSMSNEPSKKEISISFKKQLEQDFGSIEELKKTLLKKLHQYSRYWLGVSVL